MCFMNKENKCNHDDKKTKKQEIKNYVASNWHINSFNHFSSLWNNHSSN